MDLAKDRNGKTEAEFLREYDVTKYFRPSVTVDAATVAKTARGYKVLLVKRGGHPYIGSWALPGGFVEQNEPCEAAAARELYEETGVSGVALRQLVAASKPDRDPRWRNITVVFYGLADREIAAVGGDDADKAEWFELACIQKDSVVNVELSRCGQTFGAVLDVKRDAFGRIDLNATKIIERGITAFDHAAILAYLFEELERSNQFKEKKQ